MSHSRSFSGGNRGRDLTLLALALLLGLAGFGSPAIAVPLLGFISIDGQPGNVTTVGHAVQIPQNQQRSFDITVRLLPAAANAGIAGIKLAFSLGTPTVVPAGGDLEDAVGNVSVSGGTGITACFPGGTAALILPGATCDMTARIPTRDTRVPDPDVIPGTWTVTVPFQAFEAAVPANTLNLAVVYTVDVLDPMQAAPEPASFAALGSGLLGLGLLRHYRRGKVNSTR